MLASPAMPKLRPMKKPEAIEFVKAARLQYGLGITEAALNAGVQRRTWARWEEGRHPPDLLVLELFKVRMEQLTRVDAAS